jgi:predicted Ser/Thr protein kinase
LFVMNNTLVSGSYDATIRTWNVSVGVSLFRMENQKQYTKQVGLSTVFELEKIRPSTQSSAGTFSIISILKPTKSSNVSNLTSIRFLLFSALKTNLSSEISRIKYLSTI